jgi:hypothetical protein
MASEQLPNRQLRTNGNQTRSIEAHVIHASSVAVSREHRRDVSTSTDEIATKPFLRIGP